MPNCSCNNRIDALQNALEHLSSKVSFLDEKLLEKVNFQVQIGKKLDDLQQLKDCIENVEESVDIVDDCCKALNNQLEAFKGHFLVLEARVDTNKMSCNAPLRDWEHLTKGSFCARSSNAANTQKIMFWSPG